MDQIDSYVAAAFSHFPQTQGVENAKHRMSENMLNAYQGALAAGKSPNQALGEAIARFGDTGEYASANPYVEGGQETSLQDAAIGRADGRYVPLQLTEAKDFAAAYQRSVASLAAAVVLFVVAPIPLAILSILSDGGGGDISSEFAILIGIAVLLPMVAIGVVLLLVRGQKLGRFRKIREGHFVPTQEVDAWAFDLKESHSRARTTGWAVGITLWIVAAFPLVAGGVLANRVDSEPVYIAAGLGLTLVLVAVGFAFALPGNWSATVCDYLTNPEQTRNESGEWGADQPPVIRGIYAAYWPLIVAAYLLWSFSTGAWHISWIIWPIASLIFAAFAGFASAWQGQASRR